MNRKKNHWNALIVGFAGLILALTFPNSFYEKYIVNINNEIPAANAKSKAFYIVLHFLSKHFGKIGIQIILGVIALIAFYIAYSVYKKTKSN